MKRYHYFFLAFITFCSLKLSAKEYYILSIDGGGSKGVIPATILKNLEEDIGGACANVFDCISGTSTGSLIAAALTMPHPDKLNEPIYQAKDILNIYLEEVQNIFTTSFYYNLTTLWGWIGPKYQKECFKRLIIDSRFNDFKIKEALTDLIIPSFDLISETGFYFENFKHLEKSLNDDYTFSQAILASTAAPSYFSPEIIIDNDKKYVLIDGGVMVNHPTALTIRECIKNINLDDTKIYILSLGCGLAKPDEIDMKEIKNWGLIEFLPEIIDTFVDGMHTDSSEELECLKKLLDITYLRINIPLESEYKEPDITDKDILISLIESAEKCYVEEFKNSEEGKNFIALLKKRLANGIKRTQIKKIELLFRRTYLKNFLYFFRLWTRMLMMMFVFIIFSRPHFILHIYHTTHHRNHKVTP